MSDLDLDPKQFLDQKIADHLNDLLDWSEGRRSWMNTYGHLDPDVVGRLDASEVEKHRHALEGLIALRREAK